MIEFKATIRKFEEKGEKTGWTYIEIPKEIAQEMIPGNKKSFRVKGKLDKLTINRVALIPMGGGDFIMPLNAALRKGTGKRKGATLLVKIEVDKDPFKPDADFMECLADDPKAKEFFRTLPKSHQDYFSKWIGTAKTETTRVKRIAMAVNALSRKMGFPDMLRSNKKIN